MQRITRESFFSTLRGKILITMAILLLYRFASFIPLPWINVAALSKISEQTSNGLIGMLNMLSGGSLSRMSIFALTVVPYITASIVVQLLTSAIDRLKQMKKDGTLDESRIHQWTKYLMLFISLFQGYAIAASIGASELYHGQNPNGTIEQKLLITITLAAGTAIIMWLGEKITNMGIGNGMSLIIFVGIVAELPKFLISFFSLLRSGSVTPLTFITVLAVFVALIGVVTLFERTMRHIPIQRARHSMMSASMMNSKDMQSVLPLKVNQSGVIPAIFASSVLLMPATISTMFASSDNAILQWLSVNFAQGQPVFMIFYIVLIVSFTFFYADIVFEPKQISDNLKRSNTFISGIRPGQPTINYLKSISGRLSLIAGIYLSVICVLPQIFAPVVGQFFVFGGTSILIMVNVALDTITQIQSHAMNKRYSKMLNKKKV